MTTFYYEPFYSLDEFHHLFDDAFNTRTGGGSNAGTLARKSGDDTKVAKPRFVALPPSLLNCMLISTFPHRIDIHENAETNTVTATFELPGLKKEDVNIDVQNNRLTVSGESKVASDKKEEGYVLRERRYGKFSRTLPLPVGTQVSPYLIFVDCGDN